MFCLSALGEPWRILLRKFAGLFKSLDFLQILILDVYLGGFLLYIVAIIPLHLFSAITLYAITLVSIVVVFSLHWRKFRNTTKSFFLNPKKFLSQNHQSFEFVLVVSMFLFSLVIQTSPLNHLVFGSVRDTSIHSLFVQVIIENRQTPLTAQPYLDEGIVYPQGFSVIAAYSVLIFNYLPPQAVFYLTSLFNTLTILGAYFLGKTLSRKCYLGLSLAFVFAFVAIWPKYITWGSNPFVASFPLYFICLSLFSFLAKNKLKVEAIFAIGILFGYLSVLHLQTYEMLIASLFVLWLYIGLKREEDRWQRLLNIIVISGLSLLILSPFLYRALAFYPYPYHNIGLPADVEAPYPIPQANLSVVIMSVTWLFEHLGSDILLKIASLALFFVSMLMVVGLRGKNRFTQINEFIKIGIATFLGQLLISLLSVISPTDLPFYPQPLLLYLPFYFFIAALNLALYHFFSSRLSKKILAKPNEPKLKTKKLLVTIVSLMLLLGIYAPFLHQSIVLDVRNLHGSYAVYSVTTEQDLQLILWIKDNLPGDATILVNTYQSGTFIPSIANRKVVFPPFASSYSASYQKLVALLEENKLNATTYNLMERFNITNIYAGSTWSGGTHKWNPMLFLGNPNFKLKKNFGNAYLFQFNYTDPNIVFLDDFEHALWDEARWHTGYTGNGLGNVTTTTNFGRNDSRCLRMTSQVIPTVLEWKYVYSISREIFLQNNLDVTFSFHLNATEGFEGEDTFAVLISNVYRNQSMVITTPNGVYDEYAYAKTLNESEVSFSFDLSKSWHQMFNSSLPNTLILELVNYDFNGVENVAYIDDIRISSKPIA